MLKYFRDILHISLLIILANITFTESLFSQEHRQEAEREMTAQGIINMVMRDVEETTYFSGSIERVLQVKNLGKENSMTVYCVKPSLYYECNGEELWKNDQGSNKYFAPPRGFLYVLDQSKLKHSLFQEKPKSLDLIGINALRDKVSGKFISGKGTTSYTDFENLLFIGYDNKTTSFNEWSGDANCVRLELKPRGNTYFNCPISNQKNGPFETACIGREVQFEESKEFIGKFKPNVICDGRGDKAVSNLMNGIRLMATADMIVGETQETIKSLGVADVVAMSPNLLECIFIVLDISALEEAFGTFGWIEGSTYGKEALYFDKGYLEIRVSDKNQYNVSLRDNRFVYPYILLKGTEIEFQLGSTKISIKANDLK
ncbi:MAG TPA: hypothetical protein PKJ37_02935 [Acidobacteriota bacterium]|jgi:hypothetical protein|nr:hypothetical protein [Acidobacteriota bacterium]HNT16837.1 hypothetical protein [Acidobacteriota bacterium]